MTSLVINQKTELTLLPRRRVTISGEAIVQIDIEGTITKKTVASGGTLILKNYLMPVHLTIDALGDVTLTEAVNNEPTAAGIDDNSEGTSITIDSDGNVGVGNTSPAQKLDVTGQILSSAGDVNLKTVTALVDNTAILTAAQMLAGLFTAVPTTARAHATDTAVNIIAAMGGSVNGSHFEFTFVTTAAFVETITAGSGVTLVGVMTTDNESATFRAVRVTSSTVFIYRM